MKKKGKAIMARHFATEKAKRNNYDYRNNYSKEKYRRAMLKLKRSDDSDIIAWLEEKKRNGESVANIAKEALIKYYEKSK